jgi:hypothetical protein
VIEKTGAPVRTKLRTRMLLKLRYDSIVFRTRSATSIEPSLSRFASRSNGTQVTCARAQATWRLI